jgi:hypothetical protein
MLTTTIFLLLAGIFIFVWRLGCSQKTEAERLKLKSSKRKDWMIVCLILAGIPWFCAICISVARYFQRGDRCPIAFFVDDPSVLMVAFVTAFIFSYASIYIAGRLTGYSEGEWQEKSRFPHFVREDPSGLPVEIRGWVSHDALTKAGEDIFCFYDKRSYKVTSVLESNKKYKFIVAIYEPKQESFNSRI